MIAEKDISLTFAKGMSVLKAFDAANTHLTLPQVARIAGLDRAVARRLVLTLVHLGYVAQDGRVFSLTPRILVLAGGFLQGRRFGKAIDPLLRAFSHRIGEPISMAMIDGHDAVYVAHAGGEKVSIGLTVGSRVPLLSTAIGRALVAHSGAGQAGELVAASPLETLTPVTNLDRAAVARDIEATRARGYAYVDGEFEAGIAALAVPVGLAGGQASALGFSAAGARLSDPGFREEALETLKECAVAIGGLL